MKKLSCRFCSAPLQHSFADLGMSPLSNSYLSEDMLQSTEPFYPLHAFVCQSCLLVQLPEVQKPEEIFTDYAYFSSYSKSWLQHCENYVNKVVKRFDLNQDSYVVEIASNDGYLLKNFKKFDVPVLGIEPAKNVAQVAREAGIPTETEFFGSKTARKLVDEGKRADLLLGNNVLAHVPDINDFVAGMTILLKPTGVITMEFPHLMRLIDHNQFDTIYHEHFSYLSLLAVRQIFETHGLIIFDVEELPTHGGSLRIYARHKEDTQKPVEPTVKALIDREIDAGLGHIDRYQRFAEQVVKTKRRLLSFLIDAKEQNLSIVGYGAPAKGNTLLNYCGIRGDFLDYTVDRSPHKQGCYLPGTHIPIYAPEKILETKPDYVLILPWNLKDEILSQMEQIREWGGRFLVPIPEIEVW